MKKIIACAILFFNVVLAKQRISIITSVFKGDEFIESFMREIVKQTVFDQCELILINANSPGNEESVIMPYLEMYPNIKYKKLNQDPGIYGVWNIAVKMAQGDYIANANVDDGLAYNAYEVFAKTLDENPNVDLVYSDFYITFQPHQNFYNVASDTQSLVFFTPEYSYDALLARCFPHNHPMWRKSMHEKYGYFDETYFSAGDYEMWLRAAKQGALFKRAFGILGFWYQNPNGLSTKKESKGPQELRRLHRIYGINLKW